MTICPIAIVAGCKKCPAFKICPLKSVIGDQSSAPGAEPKTKTTAKSRAGAVGKKQQ